MTHKHFKWLNINNENRPNLFIFFIFIILYKFCFTIYYTYNQKNLNIINVTMLEYLDLKVTENILELLLLTESLLIYLLHLTWLF